MNWLKSIFASKQRKAESSLREASSAVDEVEATIESQIALLQREHHMHQGVLAQMVQQKAPKDRLMKQTTIVKRVEKQLRAKQNVLANVHRERHQLADSDTNSRVAGALKKSVEAQRKLTELTLGGDEALDDILDEASERRNDTKDITHQLGEMAEESDDDVHESDFNAEDVIAALGWQTNGDDSLLTDTVNCHFQHTVQNAMGDRAVSAHAEATHNVAATLPEDLVFPEVPIEQTQQATNAASGHQAPEVRDVSEGWRF